MLLRFLTALALALLLTSAASLSAQNNDGIQVSAQFESPTAAVGEFVEYTITFEGTPVRMSGHPPRVDGLQYVGRGSEGTQLLFVNGRQRRISTYTVNVNPQREGTFTIPAFAVEFGGRRLTVPAATLRVVPAEQKYDNAFFMRLLLNKDGPYYVGEAIPAEIRIYVRSDISSQLQSLPTKEADAFTHAGLEVNPTRGREVENGVVYRTLGWPLILTPLKTGNLDLQYRVDMSVSMPDRRGQSQRTLFSGGVFNRRMINLPSEMQTIVVQPLPAQSQPPGFTGAIGQFDLASEASTDRVEAGNPVTVTIVVSGEGNFDRVAPPAVLDQGQFRVYDPEVTFESVDQLGYRGRKIFDYVLIPADDTVDRLPEIPFAYFDPRTGEYFDLTVPPLPLEVTPSQEGPGVIASFNSPTPIEQTRSTLANDLTLGVLTARLRPVFTEPVFVVTNATAFLLLTGAVVLRRRQLRLGADAEHQRRKEIVARQDEFLSAAREAAQSGNALRFLEQAHRVLQIAAVPTGRDPLSVTDEEIKAWLAEHATADVAKAAGELLERCEASRFGAATVGEMPLAEQYALLERIAGLN